MDETDSGPPQHAAALRTPVRTLLTRQNGRVPREPAARAPRCSHRAASRKSRRRFGVHDEKALTVTHYRSSAADARAETGAQHSSARLPQFWLFEPAA